MLRKVGLVASLFPRRGGFLVRRQVAARHQKSLLVSVVPLLSTSVSSEPAFLLSQIHHPALTAEVELLIASADKSWVASANRWSADPCSLS